MATRRLHFLWSGGPPQPATLVPGPEYSAVATEIMRGNMHAQATTWNDLPCVQAWLAEDGVASVQLAGVRTQFSGFFFGLQHLPSLENAQLVTLSV